MAIHSSIIAWRIPGTGEWWAAVYGVAQSRTRLKRLSSSSSKQAKVQTTHFRKLIGLRTFETSPCFSGREATKHLLGTTTPCQVF